jgi:hypothetical protein
MRKEIQYVERREREGQSGGIFEYSSRSTVYLKRIEFMTRRI